MQYILTEEEFNTLKHNQNNAIKLEKQKLQKLCTKIANEMPVKWGWWKGDDPTPWGCIITKDENDEEWYCDQCPVLEICPNDYKRFSK